MTTPPTTHTALSQRPGNSTRLESTALAEHGATSAPRWTRALHTAGALSVALPPTLAEAATLALAAAWFAESARAVEILSVLLCLLALPLTALLVGVLFLRAITRR